LGNEKALLTGLFKLMNYIAIIKTKPCRDVACNIPTVVYRHENCCKKHELKFLSSKNRESFCSEKSESIKLK
jgi:hypothetical protein